MWGKVENKKVTKIYSSPEFLKDAKGTTYPPSIFEDDKKLEGFSIYPIINTNTKPNFETLYSGISESFAWNESKGQLERTYNFSARPLTDSEAKDEDGKNILDSDGNKVIEEGLKTILTKEVNRQTSSLLSQTDKWIVRKIDIDEDVPSTVVSYRKDIRTAATNMKTAITNAKDFDALISLMTTVYESDGTTVKTPATLYNFPRIPDGMPE